MPARSTPSADTGTFPAWNPRLALLVAATFFMEFLDGTILTTAIPNIAADFGVAAADVNITMTAYLMTVAMGIPLSGWFAERVGARKVFCLAITVFTLASLACAMSPDRSDHQPDRAGRRRGNDGPGGQPAGASWHTQI